MEPEQDSYRRNPLAKPSYERWMGAPFDGSEASLRLAAEHFPAVGLREK